MKTGQIDGYIGALESGYSLEEQKEWRVITSATPFVDDFITHVFFAREELIAKKPQLVQAFLRGWFETIAFMNGLLGAGETSQARSRTGSDGAALKVIRVLRRHAEHRDRGVGPAFIAEQNSDLRSADSRGVLQHGLEDRL